MVRRLSARRRAALGVVALVVLELGRSLYTGRATLRLYLRPLEELWNPTAAATAAETDACSSAAGQNAVRHCRNETLVDHDPTRRNGSSLRTEVADADAEVPTATRPTAVLPALFPTEPQVVPLLLLPRNVSWDRRTANARHLLQDGVAQSPYLAWWEPPPPPEPPPRLLLLPRLLRQRQRRLAPSEGDAYPASLVLVLDLLATNVVTEDRCGLISETVQSIHQERLEGRERQRQQWRDAANVSIPAGTMEVPPLRPLPLVIIDNRDYANVSTCPGLARLLDPSSSSSWRGSEHNRTTTAADGGGVRVRYSYRSAVVRRRWEPQRRWVRLGSFLLPGPNRSDDNESEPNERIHLDEEGYIEYRHRPIGVRTDIVQQIQEHLVRLSTEPDGVGDASGGTTVNGTSVPRFARANYTHLCHPIEDLERPIHVSYFWERHNYSSPAARLRDTVYDVLHNLTLAAATEDPVPPPGGWHFWLGVQGELRAAGRKQASPDYVAALLATQIVVVAQRDEWEDHYRLCEGLVAGALVLTDTMLGLPDGLVDGESVVLYGSAEELREKVVYYLRHHEERRRIARRGRYVAMSRHRSWHHMEQVIFGRPLTSCPSTSLTDSDKTRCPYVVNVDEMDLICPPMGSN